MVEQELVSSSEPRKQRMQMKQELAVIVVAPEEERQRSPMWQVLYQGYLLEILHSCHHC